VDAFERAQPQRPRRDDDNIFEAGETDFVAATQRVWRSQPAASAVVLPTLSP
jgi:hypothetical protein